MLKITEIQNSGFPSNSIPLKIILDFTYFDLKVYDADCEIQIGSIDETNDSNEYETELTMSDECDRERFSDFGSSSSDSSDTEWQP